MEKHTPISHKELRTKMKKAFRFLALLMVPTLVAALSLTITACGGDDDDGGGDTAAKLVSSDPADGATVPEGSSVKLTFDKDPGTLTATGGKVGGAGAARTVTADAASIVLSWDNGGSATLNFTLAPKDTTPATISSSVPANGAKDVDPAPVNTDGIVITFSENVKVVAGLDVTDGGTKLGWVASAKDAVVTLKPPKGKELVNEKEYVVSGQVEDGGGNKTDVTVTFTTKAKQ